MAITRLNNNSITSITALPSGVATGKVLQVVNANTTSGASATSSTFVDSNITATITPSSTSNKVLINIQMASTLYGNGNLNAVGEYKIVRTIGGTSTDLYQSNNMPKYEDFDENQDSYNENLPILYLDSPNTTSAVTYKIQISALQGLFGTQQESNRSETILMEIGA